MSEEPLDISEVPDRPKLTLEDRVFAMDVLEEAIGAMGEQQQQCLLPMLVREGYAEWVSKSTLRLLTRKSGQ